MHTLQRVGATTLEITETKTKPKHNRHLYKKLFTTDLMVEVPVKFNKFIRTGILYKIIKPDIGFVRFSFYSSKSKLIIDFSYS